MPDRITALSSKLSEVETKLAQVLESVTTLENNNVTLETHNAELAKEITLLRQKIDLLVRSIFGSKSERRGSPRNCYSLQGTRRSKGQSPPREGGPRLPKHLPVIEEGIVPEQVKAAPQEWRRIGEEVSERLDYEPARFPLLRTVRPKYVQRGVLDALPIVAPLPDSLLERSLVTPGLLTQIIVSKYCDHLPL